MFGYITPLKPELKIKDYTRFRGYYCGLCHGIKNNFGNIPRMALNYDMTFLALLLDSLTEEDTKFKKTRCMVHPIEKRIVVYDNDPITYASYINVILFYYKLVDDTQDDKTLKSKLGSILFKPYKNKFIKEFQTIDKIINSDLNTLYKLENNKNFNSLDEISHPFANLTGELFKLYPNVLINDCDELRDKLYWLGYNIGKWIYIIDAFDDLEDDMKKNKFNPINHLFNENKLSYNELYLLVKDRIEFTLLNCSYSASDSLKALDINKNYELLDNILSLGIMHKNHTIINNCKNQCKTNKNKEMF